MNDPWRILIIYDHVGNLAEMRLAIRQHLHVLDASLSRHKITYYNVRGDAAFSPKKYMQGPPERLNKPFDAVIFHTTFLGRRWETGTRFYHWKRNFRWMRDLPGVKLALPQDEYDYAELLDEWLYELGVSVIFSCFDAETRGPLYPIMRHHARFYKAFTGYIDTATAEAIAPRLLPPAARPFDIVYRANHLPYRFGSAGQAKHRVGTEVRTRAEALGLRCDISTRPEDAVLGNVWLDFIASGRGIIGVESGSSAIDWRGEAQERINTLLANNSNLTFEQVLAQMPSGWDDHRFLAMGPRHFEAIITKTCQVLTEGTYDGVLEADRHFIPLKHDFSNVDEALAKLQDTTYVETMADRAYREIYLDGAHTYQDFARQLEQAISDAITDPPQPGPSADQLRPYILMLVPHEPEIDPRVKWTIDLCRQVGRGHVIASLLQSNKKPMREYDGLVFIDRNMLAGTVKTPQRLLWVTLNYLPGWLRLFAQHPVGMVQRSKQINWMMHLLLRAIGTEEKWGTKIDHWHRRAPNIPTPQPLFKRVPQKAIDAIENTFSRIMCSLLERASAVSFAPRFILCHDIYSLESAIELKKQHGWPILYDTHEYWPEAYLQADEAIQTYMTEREGALIRQADVVMTVTPQIARKMESLYGLKEVLVAPNAEPFDPPPVPAYARPVNAPVQFLLQGGVAVGRGVDLLLNAWRQVDNPDAILIIRCPENPYLVELCEQFCDLIKAKRLKFASPVTEMELVEAASCADVGIIPYPGPSLNHIYACPNKLSQYMQAGLAILHHADMEFVGSVVKQYTCGLSYDPVQPETLRYAVDILVRNYDYLRRLQRNAYQAAKTKFNWAVQAQAYRQSIQKLFHRQ
jgi:glycosyltransferase involved in cell wall biosynthesis